MGFLLKGAFWFTIVLLALPLLDDTPKEVSQAQTPQVELTQTLAAAFIAFDDIRAICERHPEVCETSGQALNALGVRAREGAMVAYRYLDATFAESADGGSLPAVADAPALADALSTGTVPVEVNTASPAPETERLPAPLP